MVLFSIACLVSFVIGGLFASRLKKYYDKKEVKRMSIEVNTLFNTIIDNIYSDKSKFINRINYTVSIETHIDNSHYVLIYMLDKKDVAVFENERCVYTSELVTSQTLDDLMIAIDVWYKHNIEDVVNVFGLIFSRVEFETRFNMKVEDIKKNMFGQPEEKSDIETIIEDNEILYDIDDVLDKITKVGLDNLTEPERDFLNDYSTNIKKPIK